MTHIQSELRLESERQRSLRAFAEGQRDARRAQQYTRMVRQAERAEQRQLNHRDRAIRLRARLSELEAVGAEG